MNGRALNYPRGRVLGGCSSINGMIVMRGQAQDYAQWAAAADAQWGWEAVLPLFRELEDHHAGAGARKPRCSAMRRARCGRGPSG